MPANLTPEYYRAEREYRAARTLEEKIACLETMLRVIPKHKGTDHMQGDLRRKLARLRQEMERESRRAGKRAAAVKVEKEGAGQVALVGPPNAGKSQLLKALTNASPLVADYPFTTKLPQPGMTVFEDVQIQLVDTPPVTSEFMEPWLPDIVRRADAALIVADLGSDEVLDGLGAVLSRLQGVRVELVREPAGSPCEPGRTYRRAAIVANKFDAPGAQARLEILREFYAERFDIWPVSALTGLNLDNLRAQIFRLLKVIRVYTKEPGMKPDLDVPYTVPEGTTVLDLAIRVHKEFAETLRSARVWGSGKYEGIYVKRDHVLRDRDIVELHE